MAGMAASRKTVHKITRRRKYAIIRWRQGEKIPQQKSVGKLSPQILLTAKFGNATEHILKSYLPSDE